MAVFSKLVITRKGQALLAKILSGVKNVNFTSVSASNAEYTVEQLENLIALSEIKQTSLISEKVRASDITVKIDAAFNNFELASGYYMRTLGLYADDPDEGEILYGVAIETSGNCYIPPYNGITVSGTYVQLVITVGNAENVSLEVNPGAIATIKQVNNLADIIKSHVPASVCTSKGVHDLRYYEDKLQVYNTESQTWDDAGAGDSDTVTAKVICAGNDTEHKGGLYIGDTPISYGEADNNLDNSIVIGSADNVSGKNSIVSGTKNTCTAVQCLVLGFSNNVQGVRSIVAGESNVSEGNYGFIIGSDNTLCSYHSAIIGMENVIGSSSAEHGVLVVGNENTAGTKGSSSNNGGPSYTIICGLRNNGAACMSTGIFGTSNDIKDASDSGIFGNSNSAERVKGIGMFGFGNISKDLNFICGKFSKTPTAADITGTIGDLFVVGNGTGTDNAGNSMTATTRSNAFRITAAGDIKGTKSYTASGADYAEMFEWFDGNPYNEDRRGLFVTLDGEKIRLASADDDYILGVVSATPSVVADAQTDDWGKKWKTDIFGERLLDENGAWILNEDFREEDNESYISRLDRKEWAAVGLVGKLIVVDDSTCEVNGYCVPANGGIATKSETGYRVLSRLDENHIKVLIK